MNPFEVKDSLLKNIHGLVVDNKRTQFDSQIKFIRNVT